MSSRRVWVRPGRARSHQCMRTRTAHKHCTRAGTHTPHPTGTHTHTQKRAHLPSPSLGGGSRSLTLSPSGLGASVWGRLKGPWFKDLPAAAPRLGLGAELQLARLTGPPFCFSTAGAQAGEAQSQQFYILEQASLPQVGCVLSGPRRGGAPCPGSVHHSGQLAARSARNSENPGPAHVSLQEAFQRQAWLLGSTFPHRLRAPLGPWPLSPLAQGKTDRGWLPTEPHATHSHELSWGMRQEGQV